jgi:acyl carrier protein
MSKKLYTLIGRIMNVPVTELSDNSSPETIPSWDSFNSYLLLDELESEFQTEFSIDEVVETKNISDIKKHLKNHGIILDD